MADTTGPSAASSVANAGTQTAEPRPRLRIVRPQRPVETSPSAPSSAPASVPSKPAEAAKPESPIESEEGYLRKQYGAGMVAVSGRQHCFDIAVKMARDFPFDVQDNALTVRVEFPSAYPTEPCTFHLRNGEVPPSLRSKIDAKLADRAKTQKGNSGMASNVLRFLKNRAETLMVDRTITANYESGITVEPLAPRGKQISIIDAIKSGGKAGLGAIEEDVPGGEDLVVIVGNKKTSGKPVSGMKTVHTANGPKHTSPAATTATATEEGAKENKKQENAEDKKEEEVKEEQPPAEASESSAAAAAAAAAAKGGKSRLFASTTAHRGTQIRAEGLSLVNIGVMQCTRICAVYNCTRCGEQDVALLSANEHDKEECLKCHAEVSLCFRPDLMHEASNVVGYIDKEGAGLVDFTSSSYVITCLACGAETEGITLQPGTPLEGNCRECNERFSVGFETLRTARIKVDNGSQEGGQQGSKKKKSPREPGIEPGKPLPDEGTCKHYKHSYRWLRFPCCGRAFPCDRCHDEQSDHPCVFASRQICGHCAKEQISSNTVCSSCGNSFTNSSTRHWEGGNGCRDRSKMDRHEARKFAGLGKTTSRAAKAKAEAKKK